MGEQIERAGAVGGAGGFNVDYGLAGWDDGGGGVGEADGVDCRGILLAALIAMGVSRRAR